MSRMRGCSGSWSGGGKEARASPGLSSPDPAPRGPGRAPACLPFGVGVPQG